MNPNILAFDVETGGIDINTSLLEVYFEVLNGDTFEVIDSLLLKVKPNDGIYRVNSEALRVNRINLVDHDKVAICYEIASMMAYDFLKKHSNDGKAPLIPLGHNVNMDIQFSYTYLFKSKKDWDRFVSYHAEDTSTIATFLKRKGMIPRDVKGSLGSLVSHFNIEINEPLHTSKGDVKVTVELYKSLFWLIK